MHKSAVAQQSGASIARHPAKWFTGAVIRIALRIADAIALELRVRRDVRHLAATSDHMLKDIGLRRADIQHAVRYGRD